MSRRSRLTIALVFLGSAACGSSSEATAPADASFGSGSDANGNGSAIGPSTDGGVDATIQGGGTPDGPTDAGGAIDPSVDASTASAIPFSATGVWRTRLPAVTPIASNSAAVVATIQSDITKYYGTWSINTDTFSAPFYAVPSGAPTQTWGWNNCQGQASIYSAFAASLQNVPTEIGFVSSMGSDREIAIYSAETDTYWDFWEAVQDGGAWSACFGGRIDHASTNPGIFGSGVGAVACGLPLGGWLLRIAELQAGLIEHAVGFEIVSTQATNYSWPANRTDGKTASADAPMEGQRFRLDPSFDITTLPNRAERTIAKALQDYGMILTDTSGAVIIQAEDDRPYIAAHGGDAGASPYPAIWGNVPVYEVLKDIPVARLQALPKDYGKDFMH